MDLSNKPLIRVLCAEPLEGRWLLSGSAPASASEPASTPTYDLDVPEEVSEDEEEEEGEVIIKESDLPTNVLAAFRAEFADAKIDVVELEEDDERGSEYGITAETATGEVEVTISPDGVIVERELEMDHANLPKGVVDKVLEEFPDAVINGAADLTNGSYEVLYALGGKQWETEATPTSPAAAPTPPTTPPADDEEPAAPLPVTAPTPLQLADASVPFAPSAEEVSAEATAQSQDAQTVAQADEAATDAERQRREDAIEKNAAAAKAATATTIPFDDRTVRALDALAAGAGATVWLPEVAGALIDVLPINLDAIEQSMQDVLRQVGTLGSQMKGSSALTTGATRLAMAATLVAAVKVLLNQSKKTSTTRPALVFGPSGTSWGWVLGTTDPKRRRQIISRQREP
jgi:hypothetical protein